MVPASPSTQQRSADASRASLGCLCQGRSSPWALTGAKGRVFQCKAKKLTWQDLSHHDLYQGTIQKEHRESTKVMLFPNIFPLAQLSSAQEQLKCILHQHPELDLDPFSKTNDAIS